MQGQCKKEKYITMSNITIFVFPICTLQQFVSRNHSEMLVGGSYKKPSIEVLPSELTNPLLWPWIFFLNKNLKIISIYLKKKKTGRIFYEYEILLVAMTVLGWKKKNSNKNSVLNNYWQRCYDLFLMTCYGPQTTYPRITCTQGRGGRFFFQFLTSVAPLPKSFSIKEAFLKKKSMWFGKQSMFLHIQITSLFLQRQPSQRPTLIWLKQSPCLAKKGPTSPWLMVQQHEHRKRIIIQQWSFQQIVHKCWHLHDRKTGIPHWAELLSFSSTF